MNLAVAETIITYKAKLLYSFIKEYAEINVADAKTESAIFLTFLGVGFQYPFIENFIFLYFDR